MPNLITSFTGDLFPPKDEVARIQKYEFHEKIFLGEHYDAFNIMADDFKHDYANLRYITANFGGLISKLSADMLFEEFPSISVPKGDADFLGEMIFLTQTQIYEAGLEQSYNGDVVFRIRAENSQLIIEDINPAFYFPEIDPDNVRAEPTAHVLAWKMKVAGKNSAGKDRMAVFKEKHYKGKIVNELWEIDDHGNIVTQLDVTEYLEVQPEVKTNIDEFLVVHIPNYRTNSRYFGISDYKDLISLMFAVNNRITKIDNILDKHGDPILAVPTGVLDENGKVSKRSFGVIEVDGTEAGSQMPQYIVWDAKLESAFDEIDKTVDFLMMFSETSPAIFGLDKAGIAESGRALKFRLLRTIAKKHRKELYFDTGLKKVFYTAQLFAKANNLSLRGTKLNKEPIMPIIKWKDGVINDALEQLEIEERRVEGGFSTQAEAIASLDGITEDEALDKLKKIQKEKAEQTPKFTANPLTGATNTDNSGGGEENNE